MVATAIHFSPFVPVQVFDNRNNPGAAATADGILEYIRLHFLERKSGLLKGAEGNLPKLANSINFPPIKDSLFKNRISITKFQIISP